MAAAPERPTRAARVITIVVLTVIWFVIGKLITTSAVGVVDTVLILMLYLLVPRTVTNLIDFFFVRHGHYSIIDIFKPNGIYGSGRTAGSSPTPPGSPPRSRSWCCSTWSP